MLHWQLANLKNLPLLKKVNVFAATSCLIHVILGLFLFVFSQSHQPDLNNLQVHAHAKNVKVRLVPFGSAKRLGLQRTQNKKHASSSKTHSKTVAQAAKKTHQTRIKKITQATHLQKKKKNKQTLKNKKKAVKPLPATKQELEKIKEPEPQIKTQEIVPELPVPVQELTSDTLPAPEAQMQEEEILYVSYQELEELQLGAALQEAITGVWNPPAGMGDEAECTVFIALNKEGKVIKTTYEKISGIRIYDTTVERAIPEIQFPHQLRGKSFTLCFKA